MAYNTKIQNSLPEVSTEGKVLLPDLLDNVQWRSPCKKFRSDPCFSQESHEEEKEEEDNVLNDQALRNYLENANTLAGLADKHDAMVTTVPPPNTMTRHQTGRPECGRISENAQLRNPHPGTDRCNIPMDRCNIDRCNIAPLGGTSIFMSLKATLAAPHNYSKGFTAEDSRIREARCQWRENVDIFEHCNVQEESRSICSHNQRGESMREGGAVVNASDFHRDTCKSSYPWPESYFPIESKEVQLLALASMSNRTGERTTMPCIDQLACDTVPNVSETDIFHGSNLIEAREANLIEANLIEANASEPDSSGNTFNRVPTVVGMRYLHGGDDVSYRQNQRQQDCCQFASDVESNVKQSVTLEGGGRQCPRTPVSQQPGKGFDQGWSNCMRRDDQQQAQLNSKPTLDCLTNILKQHESMLIDWENLDYKIRQFQWAMTELYQSKEILHFKIESVSLLIHSTISSLKKFMNEQQLMQNLTSSSSTTTTASSCMNMNGDLVVENSSENENLCVERYLRDKYSCEENFTEESCHTSNPCCECKFNKFKNLSSSREEADDDDEEEEESVATQASFDRMTPYDEEKNKDYSEDVINEHDDEEGESEHISGSCLESFDTSEEHN